MNRILLVGRLGADAVVRKTKGGSAVASFPVATTRYWAHKLANGQTDWQERTTWHQVVLWGKAIDRAGPELKKGQPVFVDGEIRGHKYQAKDGSQRYAMEVHAENVRMLEAIARDDAPREAAQNANEEVESEREGVEVEEEALAL